MKRIILILGVLFAAVSTARAQYDYPRFMGTVGVSYSPIFNVSTDGDAKERTYFNGVGLSWSNAHAVSSNKPFYVGYGLGIQYGWHMEKDETVSTLTHNLSIKLPVEMLYRLETDFDLIIIPRLGADVNFFPLYQGVGTMSTSSETKVVDWYDVEFEEGHHMNRVTLGLHVGARFQLDHFFVDLSYELPAVGLYYSKYVRLYERQIHVTAGFAF